MLKMDINAYYELINAFGWKIPAGTTSNCKDTYKIEAVAKTDDNSTIGLIYGIYNGRYCLTPVETNINAVAIDGYGMPISGSDFMDAVKNFNNYANECKLNGGSLEPIKQIIMKDGTEINL